MSTSRSEQKEQERFWNEFRVGVLAIVAIGLLVLGVRFLEGVPLLGNSYPLVARFEKAGGVAEGTPVTVRGISVGTVESVTLSDEGGVRVRMQIQGDVKLTEGTTASVSGVSALDDVRIALQRDPGGEVLSPGARLPSDGKGVLETLRGEAVPLTRKVDTLLSEATGTFSEAGQVLGRSEPEVEQTLRNVQSASARVNSLLESERDRLHRTLANVERTSAALDTLVSDLQDITTTKADTLEHAVEDAQRTVHHTRRAVRSLARSTESLDQILVDLEKGRGTAGRLLHEEPGARAPLLGGAGGVAGELPEACEALDGDLHDRAPHRLPEALGLSAHLVDGGGRIRLSPRPGGRKQDESEEQTEHQTHRGAELVERTQRGPYVLAVRASLRDGPLGGRADRGPRPTGHAPCPPFVPWDLLAGLSMSIADASIPCAPAVFPCRSPPNPSAAFPVPSSSSKA